VTAFADLGLSESSLLALRDVGYEQPSPIQEQAIPVLMEGRDMIGQAQTGSGKTAAFGLPMIEHVDPGEPEVQGLVLTPTRELCIQVTQALRAYAQRKGVDVVAFGRLKDEKFWGRLKIIQKAWTRNNKLRAIAQIIDSEDVNAIKAAAEEHGITFPVIVAKQKEWDNAYRNGGRIVFTIRQAHICWRE